MKNKTTKIEALAKYLECEVEELKEDGENTFLDCRSKEKEYLVLTDEEADKMASEYILESAWAFRKSFLDGHSDIIAEIDDKTWAAVVDRCKSSNKAVLAMIPDKGYFIEDAISTYGRGQFINNYDGCENEQDDYFIYRTN